MKKQISILVLLLLSIFLISVGENSAVDCFRETRNKIAKETIKSAVVSPESVGMNAATLSRIGAIVETGINAKAFPGCQVLVLKDGKTVYDKSFGHYTYERGAQETNDSTMYDLASLSKTTGTLLAIMKLYDEGKLQLTDKASAYLPFLQKTDKENITITELLFHESGLPASLPFYQLAIEKSSAPFCIDSTKNVENYVQAPSNTFRYKQDWVCKIPSIDFSLNVSDSFYINNCFQQAAMQMIANTRLNNKTYVYSCVNFILLKEIAETISGIPMDVYLDSVFYNPMELKNLSYLPLRTHKTNQIAPTLEKDFLRNGVIQAYVHDPDAAFFGGISGNAGLFATSHDVAKIHQMLLNKGELDGERFLSEETCQVFSTTVSPSGRRGLGYDKPVASNPQHSPCCISAPAEVYGHTGYTGTSCWVDPINKLVYVFLSNRTYPNDGVNKLARMNIRTDIQELIYQSIKNYQPQATTFFQHE